MAWKTGTAANVNDLLLQLRDFLTADSALVAANQQWTAIGGVISGPIAANDFVSLKGRGLAGTDEIYLSLQAFTERVQQLLHLGCARTHLVQPLGAVLRPGWR